MIDTYRERLRRLLYRYHPASVLPTFASRVSSMYLVLRPSFSETLEFSSASFSFFSRTCVVCCDELSWGGEVSHVVRGEVLRTDSY